jgi:hypothetical protein
VRRGQDELGDLAEGLEQVLATLAGIAEASQGLGVPIRLLYLSNFFETTGDPEESPAARRWQKAQAERAASVSNIPAPALATGKWRSNEGCAGRRRRVPSRQSGGIGIPPDGSEECSVDALPLLSSLVAEELVET